MWLLKNRLFFWEKKLLGIGKGNIMHKVFFFQFFGFRNLEYVFKLL